MLLLIEPTTDRADDYFALCKEYSETDSPNYRNIDSIEKAIDMILYDQKLADIASTENGAVKTLVRWAVNDFGEIVGSCRIRLELNNRFKKKGGHIGYDVRPKYRKLGFGSDILRLSIDEIKRHGVKDILLTCSNNNVASYKIIEKNNGILESLVFDEEDNKLMRRYWIRIMS